MRLTVEALKQTQAFYLWELKKKSLTENERSKYLRALESIERVIKERENPGKERKYKKSNLNKFLPGEKEKAKYYSKRGF